MIDFDAHRALAAQPRRARPALPFRAVARAAWRELTGRVGYLAALCLLMLAVGALADAAQGGRWVEVFWSAVGIVGAVVAMGLLED